MQNVVHKAEYVTFLDWLSHQQYRHDDIGFLASLFAHAVTFAEWKEVLAVIPEEVIETAWHEYTNI